jgi:hypothetical protein
MNKNNSLQSASEGRYSILCGLAVIVLVVSGLTRVVLAGQSLATQQIDWLDLPRILVLGCGYDLVTCVYLLAPAAAYLLVIPQRLLASRGHRMLVWSGFAALCFGLACLAAADYFFFSAFNARFNLSAAGSLIHPQEIFVSIRQSYPVIKALIASILLAAAAVWLARHQVRHTLESQTVFSQRLRPAALLLAALLPLHLWIDDTAAHTGQNRVADELSGNGIYSLFSAALGEEHYYPALPVDRLIRRAGSLVGQPARSFLAGAPSPIAGHSSSDAP